MNKTETIKQFVKYGLVGVLNTVVTLVVIFVCKSWLEIHPVVSNALGYIAGVINSFLWNKSWVFRSQKGYMREAVKFLVGFGLCYLLQLLIVMGLTYHTAMGAMEWDLHFMVISGYGVATIIAMMIYTMANYLYNRLVTFR
ncbi:MAG: GtrA family protein [Muribaculaceae bacterium]|jgi:putative flippase GtrA|nr:GtrA family protein [Muribaculaceae bacterium]